MSALANATGRGRGRTVHHPLVGRRRTALFAVLVLAGASCSVLLADVGAGPAWLHWLASLVALAAGLGVVVVAEASWSRAITTAKTAGLVAPETDE